MVFEEKMLYGVGFCEVGAVYQWTRHRMMEAEENEHKNEVLLNREIRKNATLKKKMDAMKKEMKEMKKELKIKNKTDLK